MDIEQEHIDELVGMGILKPVEQQIEKDPKEEIYNLYNSYEALKNIILEKHPLNKMSKANIKVRLRMVTLYAVAQTRNALVLGTDNKDEIHVGYFTKYGDGAWDIEPIGDLYKTDVYKLAKYLNVPEEIINKPPRAGLWNNQTDEDEIGMTYELLDKILYRNLEKDIEILKKIEVKVADIPEYATYYKCRIYCENGR